MQSSPDPPRIKDIKSSDWHPAASSRGVGFLLDSPGLSATTTSGSGSSNGSNNTGETSRDAYKHSRTASRLSGNGSYDDNASGQDSPRAKQIKDAARLGSLFMNIKYAALNDIGEVSPSANQHERKTHNSHISSGTHARALRSKAYLELEYEMIRDFQQPIKVRVGCNGSEGNEIQLASCYNPLQVLRNRRIRPVPHIHESGAKDQEGWGIDPFELVADYGWRDHHLALLRKGNGDLVYPQLQGATLSPVESGVARHLGSRASPSKQDELLSRIKQRFQKLSPTNTDSSISFSEAEDPFAYGDKSNSLRTVPSDQGGPVRPRLSHQRALSTPHIILDQPEVSESEPEPSSRPSFSTATPGQSLEEISNSQRSDTPSSNSDDSQYLHNLRYLQTIYFLSANSYYHMTSRLERSMDCEESSNRVIQDIDGLVSQINDSLAHQSKHFVAARSPLVDSLRQLLLKDKTYAVDSILLDSDRVLTEASTTLNLEVRKLGERIGRLERKETTRKFIRELAYSSLAWFVTIIMWILWVIVTILVLTKKTITLPLRIIKWLVWG